MSSRDTLNIQKKNLNNTDKLIHINYSADIENKFQQKYFLFHGSNMTSWYPIVKNGLKVMSKTALMANGAAFGDGIYFSSHFDMSLGYSKFSIQNYGYGNKIAVGVFEIMEDPIKWKKSNNIYVINDENILLLRTIIFLDTNTKRNLNYTDYFLKDIPMQKQINKLNIVTLKN